MTDAIYIANYADDSTTCSVGKSQYDLETKLQKPHSNFLNCFYENDMKVNQDKFHFLSSLDINTEFSLPAGILENSGSQNLLRVTIDKKMHFSEHITNLCHEASKKIQALARYFLK